MMMKIKGKLSPDNVNVSQLKVFISYKTEEWEFASKIYYGLKKKGFQVFIDRYGLKIDQHASKKDLQSKLAEAVNDSHFICFITSDNSIKSDWINFEFKQAAATLGRVTFVCNAYNEFTHPGDIFASKASLNEFLCSIGIKHTTLTFSNPTEENINSLVVEMINDPDEYWADGVFFTGLLYDKFDLKREITRKKAARKTALYDPQFIGRHINDVIPFDWGEVGCEPGEVNKALMWIIFDCGRKHLSKGIADKIVEAKYVSYQTEEGSQVDAFVILPII